MPSASAALKSVRADPLKILLKPSITLNAPSMVSIGSFRRRWLRQGPMMRLMSSSSTTLRPSYATRALAARVTTRSPRRPSTSMSEHTPEIFSARSRSIVTSGSSNCAAAILALSALISSSHVAAKPTGSISCAMRFLTSVTRASLSKMVRTVHAMPNRSRSCGRSSPSSGFPLPIMMNFAGCVSEIPSRSTVFHPPAAESSTTSTSESSKRFTSSMYSSPRLARASSPGSYAFVPSASAFSISMVPQMRSSVVPRGTSTMGMRILLEGIFSPARKRASTSGPMRSGCVGEELKASPNTTSISGSRSASERTATDLAVPRSPMMRHPPMRASMTLRMSASLSSSWPTILTNGNAEERAAAAASEVAEAVQRRERAREEECGPAARGRTARGFPARDVMADMVRGRVRGF
mmetsp:Transcript_32713/g.52442  ORF Transcript_32713/g.52442 Transcript_32713/m.52442 type:complete len:409 (-) Transcript_32713:61-1287(-)